jgi:hypothetical protein
MLEEAYQNTISEHPELANLPKPCIPNPEDDVLDQILDVINAQTWFMKSSEVMLEYTIEGPDKESIKRRRDCSKLWLDRAIFLFDEFASTEDRIHRKIALLRELLWISTYPYFEDIHRQKFIPIWNDQVILWAQII